MMNVRNTGKRHIGTRDSGRGQGKDEGSILILVLLLMVISSLLVLPLMSYSIAVLRSNEVLSGKSKDLEGVKAGLRVALSSPVSLYKTCGDAGGPNIDIGLASVVVNGETVSTKCNFIDYQSAQSSDELRYGLTATKVGAVIPPALEGSRYTPVDPTSTTEWTTETAPVSLTDKIWLPQLPDHGLDQRPADGTPMQVGFPDCTVYFPGTYKTPVTLDGPTFFTSGIYYFESDVIVAGGADVVVGDGATPGCTTSQESLFYAENVPGTHNISGFGATWVFGKQGRLSVSNANDQPLSLVFNRRYVPADDTDTDPSADISIMTVNGDLDVDGITGIDLDAAGIIHVPVSQVGVDTLELATNKGYLPSEFTPKPEAPDAPSAVAAQRRTGAAIISWTEEFDGGSPITNYEVTASSGETCETTGATTCAITGLSTSTSVTFTVVATNAIGSSPASSPSTSMKPDGGGSLAVPNKPNPPTVTPYTDVTRFSWTAPSSSAPITKYTVTASPGGATCELDVTGAVTPPLECDIAGLPVVGLYSFTVTATNAVGTSPASNPSTPIVLLGTQPAPPVTPPAPAAFVPTAVIDVDLPATAAAVVNIPGYVAIPQGRVHVDNQNGLDVRLSGGVIASEFDVVDSRDNGPETVPIGFEVLVVQRKFRITSTSPGVGTSVAIVQVNQNGAYAINSWIVQ